MIKNFHQVQLLQHITFLVLALRHTRISECSKEKTKTNRRDNQPSQNGTPTYGYKNY